jgi:hypothetical protein
MSSSTSRMRRPERAFSCVRSFFRIAWLSLGKRVSRRCRKRLT